MKRPRRVGRTRHRTVASSRLEGLRIRFDRSCVVLLIVLVEAM